jgi:hypothetical protein
MERIEHMDPQSYEVVKKTAQQIPRHTVCWESKKSGRQVVSPSWLNTHPAAFPRKKKSTRPRISITHPRKPLSASQTPQTYVSPLTTTSHHGWGSSISVTDIRKFRGHVKKTAMWVPTNAFNTDPNAPVEDTVIHSAGLERTSASCPITRSLGNFEKNSQDEDVLLACSHVLHTRRPISKS